MFESFTKKCIKTWRIFNFWVSPRFSSYRGNCKEFSFGIRTALITTSLAAFWILNIWQMMSKENLRFRVIFEKKLKFVWDLFESLPEATRFNSGLMDCNGTLWSRKIWRFCNLDWNQVKYSYSTCEMAPGTWLLHFQSKTRAWADRGRTERTKCPESS